MKKTLTLMMVLFISISMIFAGGSSEASSSKGELRFGTGGDQGTYYGFGNVLAQRISTETDTKVVAVASNGSQDNIEMMDMNYYQLGFVQSDVMSYAYNGTNLFDGMPIDNFSTLASLYMEQVQIVTLNPNNHPVQVFTTMPSMFLVHMDLQRRTSHRHTRASVTASIPFRTERSMQHSL